MRLDETSGTVTAENGATVDLFELGDPAPPGDDFVVPGDTETDRIEHGVIFTTTSRYEGTTGDVHLGTGKSNSEGLVRLAVEPDTTGGTAHITVTAEDRDRVWLVSSKIRAVGVDAPDLAVSVTTASGIRRVERELIALNLEGRRVGTVQDPLRIVIQGPDPGPDPNVVLVPDVVDMGAKPAAERIRRGLVPILPGSSPPSAWVQRQNPSGGSMAARGSRVQLLVTTRPRP